MKCVRCDEAMISDYRWRESGAIEGTRRHKARGLCNRCYLRAMTAGTLDDWPRGTICRQELLEEVAFLVDGGARSLRTIANELNLKRPSIRDALLRAAKAGDETAISIRKVITP